MAENRALSQWEIDALLNQIPEGTGVEIDEAVALPVINDPDRSFSRLIKTYDFRRPDKFSKDQWATLQGMHDTFARLSGAGFSSRLRSLVSVRLSSIDQGLYEEWQAQVPSQTICYVLSMEPLAGNIVVEFNNDVASEVVDRLLGGTGILLDRGREMSDVDVALLRSFANAIQQSLEETWAAVLPIRSDVQDIGMDASLIQVAGPTDVVLTAFFEVNVGNHLGAMSICVPYTVIEPIASRLSAQVWFSSQRKLDERAVRAMEGLVSRMDVECDVRLGSVELPAATVAKMQEGDTLVLDTRVGQALELRVDERARFTCMPGISGNRVAVQVADVVDEPIFEFQDTALSMDPPDQVSAPQAAVPPQPASLNPGSEPPPAIPQVAEAASASGADSGTEVEQRSA
jgi:flagellar motor switch protein FliM